MATGVISRERERSVLSIVCQDSCCNIVVIIFIYNSLYIIPVINICQCYNSLYIYSSCYMFNNLYLVAARIAAITANIKDITIYIQQLLQRLIQIRRLQRYVGAWASVICDKNLATDSTFRHIQQFVANDNYIQHLFFLSLSHQTPTLRHQHTKPLSYLEVRTPINLQLT